MPVHIASRYLKAGAKFEIFLETLVLSKKYSGAKKMVHM